MNFTWPGEAEAHRAHFMLQVWNAALSFPMTNWATIMPIVFELVTFALQANERICIAISNYFQSKGLRTLAYDTYQVSDKDAQSVAQFFNPKLSFLQELDKKQTENERQEKEERQRRDALLIQKQQELAQPQ
jgi:hypothetical protein